VQRAWELLDESKASLTFDTGALNSQFRYKANDAVEHSVWALDGVTVFNQARAALAINPAGLALWRLGIEDPGAWASMGRGRLPDAKAIAELEHPSPGNDVFERFHGDIVRLLPGEESGIRKLTFNEDLGLIVRQSLTKVPKQDQLICPKFAGPKLLALTFDDGPDEKYTPEILRILAAKNAKATFFVIGRNAVRNAKLLKKIFDDGHDIGNHTYTHPDLLATPSREIEMELNGTQRVLESQLGVRTLFFRAPYSSPGYEKELEAPRVMGIAHRLGYLTVTASVDAFDWAAATSAQIEARVVSGVERGRGQVILMHDSGGDRKLTVEALPAIIDRLSQQGFKFVTLHELIDKSRADVMPAVVGEQLPEKVGLNIRLVSMMGISALDNFFPYVLVGTVLLGALRLLFVLTAALIQRSRQRSRVFSAQAMPSIAVLIPAYNEHKVICKTIASVLASSSVIDFEVIVIDDGSSDKTAEIARAAFSENKHVKVLEKPNGGKASALNFGLTRINADVVLILDADTVLGKDAVGFLARHFADPRVGAVAGNAIVGNPVNLITRFQSLEYITGQNLDRRAFELFNAIGVVPGAIGAWRRQALLEIGGFATDTLAEDADATLALQRRGWKILYEPSAQAFTEAPETLRAFLKQRFRWVFGTLQVAHKHAGEVFSKRASGVALITIPNVYIFQIAYSLLAPFLDAALLLNIYHIASIRFSGSDIEANDYGPIAQYWLFFQAVDFAAAAAAMKMNGHPQNRHLLWLTLLQRFCYRQLFYCVAIRSIAAAVKGQIVGWGKLARTGRVASAPPLFGLNGGPATPSVNSLSIQP
jgi:peptidoglycan-N-acetylglucosamine deacetylase